jgi:hypothetical protein
VMFSRCLLGPWGSFVEFGPLFIASSAPLIDLSISNGGYRHTHMRTRWLDHLLTMPSAGPNLSSTTIFSCAPARSI